MHASPSGSTAGEVLLRTYRPCGWRRDGPLHAYESVALEPGLHEVAVTLAELDEDERRAWTFEREMEFPAGRAPVVEFRAGVGWVAE